MSLTLTRRTMTGRNYINGEWVDISGDAVVSTNPADPDDIIWTGSPTVDAVDAAVDAARDAYTEWGKIMNVGRLMMLRKYQAVVAERAEELARLITAEVGKPYREALFEANALAGKVDIALSQSASGRMRPFEFELTDTRNARCRFRGHGVMSVIGPFNFPAHLPNGHFIPAMMHGNTIIFKPSEKAPAVGQFIAELWEEVGLPPGVFNVVHGGADVASALINHDGLDGILFTGSWPVGRKILEANLDRPGRMIALEMGGNNPAIVLEDAHLKQAVIECARSAFATTGQRCTCTRRIIVHEKVAEEFTDALCELASTLNIGPGDSEEPVFMGPLISEEARDQALAYQADLVKRGGRILVEAEPLDGPGWFITPGVIEVDRFTRDHDVECFAPIVQISKTDGFQDAIEQANATKYGLAAAVFTKDQHYKFARCVDGLRAGCINWNTGTAGASSKLPFGGTGFSGNNRPAALFANDYCAYPVAFLEESSDQVAVPEGMQWMRLDFGNKKKKKRRRR